MAHIEPTTELAAHAALLHKRNPESKKPQTEKTAIQGQYAQIRGSVKIKRSHDVEEW